MIKGFLLNLSERIFSARLDFRVRLFNVLALSGLTVGVVMTVIAVFRLSPVQIVADGVSAALSWWLLAYSMRTGRYKVCYLITIAAIFLGLFTGLFFIAGGYDGGVPFYFFFAVTFTVYMLEGKLAIAVAVLEIIYYAALCVFGYLHPELIRRYATEQIMLVYKIAGFVIVSVAVGATMFLQFRLYGRQQRELEEVREKLKHENESLDKLNRMKTEFLGNVSHEMKTPLTVISGYAQESGKTLAGKDGLEDVAKSSRLIASEADRLALMVSQVLDVTRIDENRMNFDIRPYSMNRIIQETLQTYYPVFSKNNNTLEIMRGGESLTVLCDAQRISQVLVNLVANAVRHTYNGKIAIGAKREGDFGSVFVSDTGEGISQERMGSLFERFNMAEAKKRTHTGENTGTGLGLYICRHIINEHGGEIAVESKLGEGTTVRFTLPLQT